MLREVKTKERKKKNSLEKRHTEERTFSLNCAAVDMRSTKLVISSLSRFSAIRENRSFKEDQLRMREVFEISRYEIYKTRYF